MYMSYHFSLTKEKKIKWEAVWDLESKVKFSVCFSQWQRQKYVTLKRKKNVMKCYKRKHNIEWYIHNKSNHVKLCIRTWVKRKHEKLKAVTYICSVLSFMISFVVLWNIKKSNCSINLLTKSHHNVKIIRDGQSYD